MTSQQILQSDLLDIVFENRNKSYGAYALRRAYQAQMLKALAGAMSLMVLTLLLPRLFNSTPQVPNGNEGYVMRTAVIEPIPPEVEQPKTDPPKAKQFKTSDYANIELVDKEVPPLATQDDLLHSVVSNKTEDGPMVPDIIEPVKSSVTELAAQSKAPEPPKEVKPDKQPQFPGGMQAWAAFLNANLRSPQDLESGEKRTVHIRFHVDVDGTITAFHVVQSGGAAFDNEVIRVLKRMPRWEPAVQAGQPVAVSFTQPVTFVGMEE